MAMYFNVLCKMYYLLKNRDFIFAGQDKKIIFKHWLDLQGKQCFTSNNLIQEGHTGSIPLTIKGHQRSQGQTDVHDGPFDLRLDEVCSLTC